MSGHTFLVIFGSTFLLGVVRTAWAFYKERKMREPTPMRLKNGVYVPWGIAERSRFWGRRVGEIAIIYFAALLIALFAKAMGWWSGIQ